MHSPEPLERLIAALSRFPGVGRKSARRMAYHLLEESPDEVARLGQMIVELPQSIQRCRNCFSYSESDLCPVCSDTRRDRTILCVVERASDIEAFERSGVFRGLYHVLGGNLSPLDGIGPEQVRIPELLRRVEAGVREVILATGSSTEGEATALYIDRALQHLPNFAPDAPTRQVTRLARGIPMGTDLEYLDEPTLSRAFQARSRL